jgi:hypothetical protein
MWRLTKERDLEDRIYRGIDVADLRSAILINQRWECVHADFLTDHSRARLDATPVAAPKAVPSNSGNEARRRRDPSRKHPGSPPAPNSNRQDGPSPRGAAGLDWQQLVLLMMAITLLVLGIIYWDEIYPFFLGPEVGAGS